MLLVKFSITLLIGVLLHGGALAEKPTYKDFVDAFAALNEYTMDFGMYDSKVLYDLVVSTKGTGYYDYIIWDNDNKNDPYDSYMVYAVNHDLEPLVYSVNSEKYQGNVYLLLGITGSNDDAYPFITIYGEGNFDKKVKEVRFTAEESYEIKFKTNNDTNIVDSGMFMCFSLINYHGLDIIRQLSDNYLKFSISIIFSNGKSIEIESTPVPTIETNSFYWLYNALRESRYIDENNMVQMQISEAFSVIDKNKDNATIKCLTKSNINARKPYGLKINMVGETGLFSSEPWVRVQVENTTNDKIVDGFDLVYYGKTVYGDVIEFMGDQGYLQYKTIIKDIKPKAKYTTPKIFVLGYRDIKTVCMAIRKIHFKDGTSYDVPLRDLIFIEYDIEY